MRANTNRDTMRLPGRVRALARSLTLTAVLALYVAALPGTAAAGTYDVYACDPGVGGGASPSFGGWADSGLTTYTDCPAGEGIVARSVWDNGLNSIFQGAYQVFDAPPGDTVDSLHAYIKLQRPSCGWGVGVVASNGDLAGQTSWYLGADPNCAVFGLDWTWRDLAINATRVRIEARCGASSCRRGQSYSGGPGTAVAELRGARVTVRDDAAPQLTNGRGSLWGNGGWVSGLQDVAFDAEDGSGIREANIQVDGDKIRTSSKPCDYTQRAPCPSEGTSKSFDTAAIRPDGAHTLTLEATDTAGNTAQAAETIKVDNSPPAAPSALNVDGGEAWRPANDFRLSWRNPTADNGSPFAGVEYQLCPSSGTNCSRGSRSGAAIASLAGVKVPSAGDWVLQLWLRDAAGNQDQRNAAQTVHLRFDDTAPVVAFEAPNPADPTLVSAKATDTVSGIAEGHIEIRQQGTDTWQALQSAYDGAHITARLDDEHLRKGNYELRVYAVDRAGNERTSQDLADGGPATIALPVRLRTRLRAGIAGVRHGRRRSIRIRSQVRVRYGRPVRLVGRLLSADGNPLQDAEILVYSQARRAGAAVRLVASLKTSRLGGFSYRAPKGVSRTVRFRFNGTGTIRPSLQDVALLVAARSTIHADRRHVVNGESVRLRGRLRGTSVPAEGKLLELQVKLRGRWHTFATTHAARNRRWHYEYRFDGTRGTQTYLFRAHIPREANYPYEPGTSRAVKVYVHGL